VQITWWIRVQSSVVICASMAKPQDDKVHDVTGDGRRARLLLVKRRSHRAQAR
jgi:hypothetical protein